MAPDSSDTGAGVPTHVRSGDVVWNLVARGDGVWGIQQGLSHQGTLELDTTVEPPLWRVVTTSIAYPTPDVGFPAWSDAVDDFLSVAGSDAIDHEA